MNETKAPVIPLWQLHSKREKLACLADYARWKLGLLDKYLNVDYNRVERVIFVCKGNICRSAYAEAKFNMLAAGAISAGTQAKDGRPANEEAFRVASARGVGLGSHRTRNLTALEPQDGDLYVCMEREHALVVDSLPSRAKGAQIFLLGGMDGFPRISDPYGGSTGYFEKTFDRLDILLLGMIERLRGCKHLDNAWRAADS